MPYLCVGTLYDRTDFTKPWDAPDNAEAKTARVAEYRCPSAEPELEPNQTVYLAVVTPESCLRPMASLTIPEITDGMSDTIVVAEVPVKYADPWMAPRDADLRLVLRPKPDDDLHHSGGNHALFADGSVRFLSSETPTSTLRNLTTAARGDVVGED